MIAKIPKAGIFLDGVLAYNKRKYSKKMETSHLGSVRSKIAEKLKEARVLAGLTQVAAAAKIGISRPSLSEIEAGNRKVSAEAIVQFSDVYNVNASWLLNEGKIVRKRLPRK